MTMLSAARFGGKSHRLVMGDSTERSQFPLSLRFSHASLFSLQLLYFTGMRVTVLDGRQLVGR